MVPQWRPLWRRSGTTRHGLATLVVRARPNPSGRAKTTTPPGKATPDLELPLGTVSPEVGPVARGGPARAGRMARLAPRSSVRHSGPDNRGSPRQATGGIAAACVGRLLHESRSTGPPQIDLGPHRQPAHLRSSDDGRDRPGPGSVVVADLAGGRSHCPRPGHRCRCGRDARGSARGRPPGRAQGPALPRGTERLGDAQARGGAQGRRDAHRAAPGGRVARWPAE